MIATLTNERSVARDGRSEFFASLSEQDRRLYRSIPGAVDYMPHPKFRLASTEAALFGPAAAVIAAPRWRPYLDIDDPEARPPKMRSLLSTEQEQTLFLRYNYARYRLARLVVEQNRRFSRARAVEMLRWYRRVLEARSILAAANMALVVAMAKRMRINVVEFAELVSEGNVALLRAVDKFDVARGFKFSTYACRAILKGFSRLASRSGTYRQHFPTEFDPELEPSDELDRRRRDQRELAIEDLHRVLAQNMAGLSHVEQAVVTARFAVAGKEKAQTLEEVGKRVGLSKERVRQVQIDALAKLRAALVEQSG